MPPKHASPPIDVSRPGAILDLSALTLPELGALTETTREGHLLAGQFTDSEAMYQELGRLRVEVRHAFLAKFFSV